MHQPFTRIARAMLFSGALTAMAIPAVAQIAADNTKVNTRDRAKGAITADQQKENARDRELVRQIRQSLIADKALSTYAHNIKVVAKDGRVTLKGPVRSEDEKQTIQAKAVEIAGADRVTNDLSVAPPAPKAKS